MQSDTTHPIDRWLPWMIGGVFLVLTVVLGLFVRTAFGSFNGVITDRAYEKGLAYNDELSARRRQVQSGFVPSLHVTPTDNNTVRVSLTVASRDGKALTAEGATIRFIRPTRGGMDQTLRLALVDGALTGDLVLPARGVWDIVAQTSVGGVPLQAVKRIVL